MFHPDALERYSHDPDVKQLIDKGNELNEQQEALCKTAQECLCKYRREELADKLEQWAKMVREEKNKMEIMVDMNEWVKNLPVRDDEMPLPRIVEYFLV